MRFGCYIAEKIPNEYKVKDKQLKTKLYLWLINGYQLSQEIHT